jgi:hypothetical protein
VVVIVGLDLHPLAAMIKIGGHLARKEDLVEGVRRAMIPQQDLHPLKMKKRVRI